MAEYDDALAEVDGAAEEGAEVPHDPVFGIILTTVEVLARRNELDVPCYCPGCLTDLAIELYERVSPYKRALTV